MDIKNKFYKNKFWAGVLLAQFILFYLLSKSATVINTAERFFEFKKDLHTRLFADLQFSVGDLLYIFLVLFLIIQISKIIRSKHRKIGFRFILILLNVTYFFYQISWGLLYFQTPIADKLQAAPTDHFVRMKLTLKYLDLCKKDRELVKEDRNGVFKVYQRHTIPESILKGQSALPQFINQKPPLKNISLKPSFFAPVMSYSGISGYYNPFTAEAQYNPNLPSTSYPFTVAHEMAHQLGYAREQEASFIAFLTGTTSDNADLRYSTNFFALKSLLRSLQQDHPEFVRKIISRYTPEMKKDRIAEIMFAEKHRGIVDEFFGFTNDLFLKGNQQEGSVTYSYFVHLLEKYESKVE